MDEVIVSVECQVQILILVFFQFSQFLFILKQTRVAKKLHNEEMLRFIKRKKQKNKRRQRFRQYMLRRRKLFFRLFALACTRRSVHRGIWVKPRTTDLYRDVMNWTPNDWYEKIRMSQQSFNHICDQLSVFIERRTTKFRSPHPVGKRVMVTLWRLATNIEFRTLGHLFGMGLSTACMIFHDVVDAINSILLPKYIKFPTVHALRNTIDGFRTRWGFPQCCGAIDGTHILIIAPKEHHADYYNRKCHHSVLLQAVVDYNYRFTNINVGHAGKHHDAHVLRESSVFLKASAGELLPNWTENLDNVEVPPFIIGDPAYPLLTWLMKAYPGNNLSQEQKVFNFRLSRASMTVECAFGRLKGRWRCLIKRLDNELYSVSGIAKACCTLHNLCEVHGDFFNENWLEDIDDNVNVPANRNDDNANTDAKQIRKAITNWLKDN